MNLSLILLIGLIIIIMFIQLYRIFIINLLIAKQEHRIFQAKVEKNREGVKDAYIQLSKVVERREQNVQDPKCKWKTGGSIVEKDE